MPLPFRRLSRGIPFYQIERCIPVEWRKSLEKPLNGQKVSNSQSNVAWDNIIGLHENIDKHMVDSLLTALKDFASQGFMSKAFRTFSLIRRHAFASGCRYFVTESLSSLLLSCTQLMLLLEGRQVHAQAIVWGLQANQALVPKLVSFYSTFGFLDDSHSIASTSNIRHPLPWNVLISSYVSKGCLEEAIYVYKEMVYKGIRPDEFTYPSVLKACGELSNLDFAREVHKSICASSFHQNLFVQNALVSMYGKCGDVETARHIFEEMQVKDEVSWNSIISLYAAKGIWDVAFELFDGMRAAGVKLNIITWNTIAGGCLRTGNFRRVLQLLSQMKMGVNCLDPVSMIIGLGACSHIGALKLGKEIHGSALRNSVIDYLNVKNALITLYTRCGDLSHANTVFRSIETKSIITWNSIISGYAHWDRSKETSFLLRELLRNGSQPNYVTLASVVPLCARVANLQHGKEFHCYILRHEGFQQYLLLWNALIDMYARSGKVSIARRLFDLLQKRDVVTYSSMIAGYGMQGEGKVAVKLFEEMIKSEIKPDHISMVAVLSACSHSGLVARGKSLFEEMQSVYCITPNLDHFACMVDLYGRAGLLQKSKEIILRMPYKATAEMWATLLGACRIHRNTFIGEWAAEKLLEMKPENSGYYVLIANMYAAAGCWSKLAEVRTAMRDLGVKKDPGCAWVDTGTGFSPFLVEDTSNRQSNEIYLLLGGLTKQMNGTNHASVEDTEVDEEVFLESVA